jgi:CubicO group peptidase (beta-lactamase class C family)
MDIIMYKKAATFLTNFYSDRKALISEVPVVSKTASPAHLPVIHPFERATPESVGIESEHLHAFLEELEKMTELHPHSLMVMKDEKIILETDFYPYRRDTWHVSHSLCKSITALAVGLMVDDGILTLDDKLIDIFPKRTFNLDLVRQKEITIRTLLDMSAGVSFNEMGSVLSDDWLDGFFGAGIKHQPGSKFMYNSMNSYMLSACIRERAGKDMFDILSERIFHPMDITEVYWEKCPKGITKGGWGLYMKIEDMMKFASLFLAHGVWNGKRLISEEWITEMTSKQIETPPSSNKHGYGFHVWRSIRPDSYQFNGMLGQNLIIFPDIHMAIATYSGSAEFFPSCMLMDLIEKYFGATFRPSPEPLKPARRAHAALTIHSTALALPPVRNRTEEKKQLGALASVIGKSYHIDAKNIGILPVVMSLFHRNYSDGIKKIAFEARENIMEAVFYKEMETIRIPFSPNGNAVYFDFFENGEHFYAASILKATKNEDDIPVLKLSIYFLETTSVRHVKFFFHRTKTVVKFTEEPTGREMLGTFMPVLEDMASKSKAALNIMNRFDFGIVDYNVDKIFSPEFTVQE